MAESEAGSYDYSVDSEEFKRLKHQAEVGGKINRDIFRIHEIQDGMRVLDIGCGPGFISRLLADMTPNGSVLGLDVSSDFVKLANEYNTKHPLTNLVFKTGNIYELSKLEENFDFIFCSFVFQHLDRPIDAMKEVYDRLNPGGIALIEDVDDQLQIIYPENELLTKLYRMQGKYQAKMGGDRFVGRKLHGFMKKVGLIDPKIHIETVNSISIGMKTFLDLTTGYKVIFLDKNVYDFTKKDFDRMYEECLDGEHVATIGVYTISAKKK